MPNFDEYSVVFICLGVYSQNYALNTTEASALVDYLDAGGQVYMEGGDCWAYDSSRTIYNGHFGINGTSDGAGDLSTVAGQEGTMCEGMSYSYVGGNSYIDHMNPVGDAAVIFRNPADGAGCGITNDAGSHRTIGCAFEFGGLVDGTPPSTRSDLMDRFLEFFGLGGTGVDDEEGRLARFAMAQNSPNPFNPSTTIRYDLPAPGRVELAVYNAAGRRVANLIDGDLEPGGHTATWNGVDEAGRPVASGVYFFRLTHGGESVTRKGVLLK